MSRVQAASWPVLVVDQGLGDFANGARSSPDPFALALAALRDYGATFTASLDDGVDRITSGECQPALIVFFSRWPGEIGQIAIDRLRAAAPLARLVAVLGPWHEGEPRTGAPWPGVTRIYWQQWFAKWAAFLADPRVWTHEPTASEDDRLLAVAPPGRAKRPKNVAIFARSARQAEALADICRLGGHSASWHRLDPTGVQAGASPPDVIGSDVVLWDIDRLDDFRRELAVIRRLSPTTEIIALADFPRPEDSERLAAHGVRTLFSKPLLVNELLLVLSEDGHPASAS